MEELPGRGSRRHCPSPDQATPPSDRQLRPPSGGSDVLPSVGTKSPSPQPAQPRPQAAGAPGSAGRLLSSEFARLPAPGLGRSLPGAGQLLQAEATQPAARCPQPLWGSPQDSSPDPDPEPSPSAAPQPPLCVQGAWCGAGRPSSDRGAAAGSGTPTGPGAGRADSSLRQAVGGTPRAQPPGPRCSGPTRTLCSGSVTG